MKMRKPMSEFEAINKIIYAIRWYKVRKHTIIQLCKDRLERTQILLCRLFRGYLFRKAFLSNYIIFMDVFLPEGIDGDVEGTNLDVYVIGDFTDDPWNTRIKCNYSPFFQAYTTTIPVVDGSQFKFIVDGELLLSSDHNTQYDTELKTENNIVKIFHYIFEGEGKGSFKKKSLLNSLSLSNPVICNSILDMEKDLQIHNNIEKGSKMHNDSTNKYKNASKNDDYFNMEEDEKTPNSPPVKLEGILEVMEDLDIGSDESDDAKELMTAIKPLTVRILILSTEKIRKSDLMKKRINKIKLICGAYHIGKDNDENSSDVYEDAYFLHPQGIGIADGVSSWSAFNIRTDAFSSTLMEQSKCALVKFYENSNLNVNPQNGEGIENPNAIKICPCKIMDEGFSNTHHCGSSTCCIAVLNDNKLDISNLGDSGFMSFEYKYEKGNYKVFLKEKSKPQQHSFNYPLQLVRLPNEETYK